MRKALCAMTMGMALAMAGALFTPAAHAAPPAAADELRDLRGYDTGGDPEAALRHIDEVLARAAKAPRVDPLDLLYAQAVRARALSSLNRTDEALALFLKVDAALTVRKAPMGPERASLLLHIGAELAALGKLDEAEGYTRRAIDLAAQVAGRKSPEYAETLYGLALIEYQRGRQNDAIPHIAEALEIARAHALATGENPDAPAEYGLSLAALQLNVSDAETAVVTAREAAAWAEAHLPENHRVRVATAQQLGAILSEAAQYGEAIPILRATLEKRRAILPADSPQVAMSLHALAYALDNAGMRAEAGPLYDKAVAIFEGNPDRIQANGLSTMIGQQARMAQWEGDRAKGTALRRKALEVARRYSSSGEDQTVLMAEYNLAAALVDDGHEDEAAPLLAHARAGFEKGTAPTNRRRVITTVLAARLEDMHGRTAAGAQLLADALAPTRARLLDRATARRDVVAMASEYRVGFMQLARIAARGGESARAFDAMQMGNLGDLQGAFSSLAVLQDDYGPQAREAIRSYLALAARSRQLRKALDQALIAANEAATRDLTAQVAAIDADLRAADDRVSALVPGYRALTAVEPARLEDARSRLKPGQGLLLIGADDYGVVTQLVTREGLVPGEARVSARRLSALQQRLRASVDAGLLDEGHAGFDRQAAWELYQLLFPDPVRKALAGVRDLQVLASGSLATLPFSALVTRPPEGDDADPEALRRTRWLIRDHAVSAMISAEPLPLRPASASTKLTFAGIGAPLLGPATTFAMRSATRLKSGDFGPEALGELGSLPDAARELRSMASHFSGDSQLLLGPMATEAMVKQAPLEQARVIAFATHGLVGGALRGVVEPALVMTPPKVPTALDDGLLTASEVAQLRLDADWVILSACDTSAGDSENAPTYSGLARAFVAAGSRALLLSHWPVRDDVASRLTLRTLEGTRAGLSRAEALRRAQLEVLRDKELRGGSHPASWAAFVLVGD